jgi:ComF family protein
MVYIWLKNNLMPPGRCPLCHAAVRPGRICDGCLDTLPWLTGALCRCGLPWHGAAPEPAPLCGRCLRRPPPFAATLAALRYQAPLDGLVNAYKHRGRLAREAELARLWLPVLRRTLPDDTDALVPVPTHWRRRWRRGFDQAERLARCLADAPGMPACYPALSRHRATPAQQGRSATGRRHALTDAFHCARPVSGMHLVLLDDVMTTGATTRAATRALLAGGAESVTVAVLARALP